MIYDENVDDHHGGEYLRGKAPLVAAGGGGGKEVRRGADDVLKSVLARWARGPGPSKDVPSNDRDLCTPRRASTLRCMLGEIEEAGLLE